jgi:SAM-dependent methyltransferase
MEEPPVTNPHGRFTGLAEIYARSRPSYPAEAIDHVLSRCSLHAGSLLVDVGCGTGISSRLFAGRGLRVIGVEPNSDMRRQAAKEPAPPEAPAPEYRDGTAEATGLPGAVADAVLAAQAFHWFEPEPTLREWHRILKPGGWVALMWNERDAGDPFTAAYGDVVWNTREARDIQRLHGESGNALLASSLFQDGQRAVFPNEQALDEEALIGRAFSVSHAPREPAQAERLASELRALFARLEQAGKVNLRYATSVFTARRRDA